MTLKQVRTFEPEPPARPGDRTDYTFRSTVILDADTLFSAAVMRTADEVGRILGPGGKELPNGPMVALVFTSGREWNSVMVDAGQYKELTGMPVPEDWWSDGD